MNQKAIFKKIFLVIAIILPILPVLVTFSSFLTGIFNRMGWYVWIQNSIVPYEARLVAVLIKIAGINGAVTEKADYSMVLIRPGGATVPVALEWNCLGWQSMIILLITLITGLRGKYTLVSKFETLIIGVLGTFLSNLFRMALIVTLAYYINNIAAMIIHDYFAAFVALIWMTFFWWFAYSYVLEEKISIVRDEAGKI